ncbi:MAG: 50S ribosomal protein L4 [Candidatus Omnitrophota bacterium]
MLTCSLFSLKGEEIEKMELPKEVFDGKINRHLLSQAAVVYHANQRQGTASTLTRGEVSGGGKKPWRQKGTGRARVGSNRSPLWRHGGVTFGPHPREFRASLPERMKQLALRSSLNDKALTDNLLMLETLSLPTHKTKDFVAVLSALKLKKKTLVLIDEKEKDIKLLRSSRNVPFATLRRAQDVNAMEVLAHEKVLMTKAALKILTQRIK